MDEGLIEKGQEIIVSLGTHCLDLRFHQTNQLGPILFAPRKASLVVQTHQHLQDPSPASHVMCAILVDCGVAREDTTTDVNEVWARHVSLQLVVSQYCTVPCTRGWRYCLGAVRFRVRPTGDLVPVMTDCSGVGVGDDDGPMKGTGSELHGTDV